VEIQSPYKVKEILVQRRYKGYLYRKELVDDSEYGGDGKLQMVCCYSLDTGDWIGSPKLARFLCNKMGLTKIQKAKKTHCVASIGFNEKEQKWYGWSHRAIFGFGIGDKIFKERFGDDKTHFAEHGDRPIKTLTDAKIAAKRFAKYVS